MPIGLAIAGGAAFITQTKSKRNLALIFLSGLIGLITITFLTGQFAEDILFILSMEKNSYQEKANLQDNAVDSLGTRLIVNQPLPIRLFLGIIYLFVFPIPFWHGFQAGTAYHLFKSINVLFFYALIPLLLMSIFQIWKQKIRSQLPLIFLFFSGIGYSLAIAATSLETRHFGSFFLPIFILVLLPDLRMPSTRYKYQVLLKVFLSGVIGVHITWYILKAG